MSEPIFRSKSLDKVKSPDNLNEYIRVSNPTVWILMLSAIFLLLGFCIWGIFGHLQTVVKADAHCENGAVTCFVSDEKITEIRPGMPVTVGTAAGTVQEVSVRSGNTGSVTVALTEELPDGIYEASIELENLHPSAFLFH